MLKIQHSGHQEQIQFSVIGAFSNQNGSCDRGQDRTSEQAGTQLGLGQGNSRVEQGCGICQLYERTSRDVRLAPFPVKEP